MSSAAGPGDAREIVAAVRARCAELRVLSDAAFDAVTLQVLDEVPRRVWTSQDARRVVGKLVAVAEQGSLNAAALLLLANDRDERPRGVEATSARFEQTQPGDQTLYRLLAGFLAQLHAHRGTGIDRFGPSEIGPEYK